MGAMRWQGLAKDFLDSLEREGTRSDGSFIAFRSALTGVAPQLPAGLSCRHFPACS